MGFLPVYLPCVLEAFRIMVVPKGYDLYLEENNTYAVIKDEQHFYEKNGIFVPYVDLGFKQEYLIGVGISPTLDFEATKESILRITGAKYSKNGFLSDKSH